MAYSQVFKVIGAVILIGMMAVIYFQHEEIVKAKLNAQIILMREKNAREKIVANNLMIEKQNEEKTNELASDFGKTVTAIKSAGNMGIVCRGVGTGGTGHPRNRRMRYSTGSFRGITMSPTPTSTQGADATASDHLATRLPQDCAVTTAMTLDLQKFITTECHATIK